MIITKIEVTKDFREHNALRDFLTTATNVAEYVIGKEGKEAVKNLKEKRDYQVRKGIPTVYTKNGYIFSMGGLPYQTEFIVEKQLVSGTNRMNFMENYNSYLKKKGKDGQLKSFSTIKGSGNYRTITSPSFDVSPLFSSNSMVGLEVSGEVKAKEQAKIFQSIISNISDFVVGENLGKEAVILLLKKYFGGEVDKKRVSEVNRNIISSTSISRNNYTYFVEFVKSYVKFSIRPTSLNPIVIQ